MNKKDPQLTITQEGRTPLAVMRFACGLTQKELADACQLSSRTVLRAEAGHRPSLKSAGAIARALNVSPEQLWPELGSSNSTDPINEKTSPASEVSQ
jgi:transcriptional regulator with XRE-family HTH domain